MQHCQIWKVFVPLESRKRGDKRANIAFLEIVQSLKNWQNRMQSLQEAGQRKCRLTGSLSISIANLSPKMHHCLSVGVSKHLVQTVIYKLPYNPFIYGGNNPQESQFFILRENQIFYIIYSVVNISARKFLVFELVADQLSKQSKNSAAYSFKALMHGENRQQ